MTSEIGRKGTDKTSTGAADSPNQSVSSPHEIEKNRSINPAHLWRVGRLTLLVLAAVALFYWLRFRPVDVRAHTVQRGDIVVEVLGTGTLEARVKAVISPKISGRVAKMLADQGDEVSVGQELVQLDDEELSQQVEIASASVAAAEAALDRVKADKDRAVAVHHQAEFDYDRTKGLYDQDTAASVEIEKATEALSIARAELARADAGIVEAQKDLIAEEKTLAYHRARLSDTKLKAPFDGLIVRRHRDRGDVVVPGSPVLTLISTDEVWISAWVDETEIARLRPEQPARIVFRSEPKRFYPGLVVRLGREADRETREFVVDVRAIELPLNWAVGQRAEVYIETASKKDVVLLPADYVERHDGSTAVFVMEKERAVQRSIEAGLTGRGIIEVLHGLQAGDIAVAPENAGARLRAGQRIRIQP